MNYTVKKTDNYRILLKPNEFYENETLEDGGYYPSAGVKNYIINFGYDFKANQKLASKYSYNVTAELDGICDNQEGEYKNIWNRKFDILETKTGELNSDKLLINEEVKIDYEYFYNLMLEYEETYGVQLDSVLKVKFNIDFSDLDGKEMKDFIELDINLNEVITNLEENYQVVTTNKTPEIPQNIENRPEIMIALILIISIMIIFFVNKMKNRTSKDKYRRKVKSILKYCKDLIVTVNEKPNFGNLKFIKIENLDSLVNLSEQTKNNIIYYEELKDRKSNFYVVNGNFVYVFEIREDMF